ncbi:MAG: hypothetical protein ACKO1N_01645 [Erythrobacter sp.]
MRDQDKPFLMYRRGPWSFSIVPRGPSGWFQLGVWLAIFALLSFAFAVFAQQHEGQPIFTVALVIYLVLTLVWSVAMIWWMRRRAEVVDVEAMLRLKREAERKARHGR